jgi:small subunit ribosomal protein S20
MYYFDKRCVHLPFRLFHFFGGSVANHKSAVKRARQNDKRRARNTGLRSQAKTEGKKALLAITSATSRDEALKALQAGERALHKAVSKGVLPKERASRKVSRLATALNKKFESSSASSARR